MINDNQKEIDQITQQQVRSYVMVGNNQNTPLIPIG